MKLTSLIAGSYQTGSKLPGAKINMRIDKKFKENHLATSVIESQCRNCSRSTNHRVINDIEEVGREQTADFTFDWNTSYQIIQCEGCKTLGFRTVSTNSEDYHQYCTGSDGKFETEYKETIATYPNAYSTREPVINSHLLPVTVQTIYLETIRAFSASQPVLCGIGIRAIIETICKHEETNGRLQQQIDQLVDKGILTKQAADTLHTLRIMGNEAAHEVKPHKEKSLSLALDIVDHLLKGCYILPHLLKDGL